MTFSDFVQSFNPLAITIFNDAYRDAPVLYPELATIVSSTLPTENYSWIGQLPMMRQFLDERQVNRLKEYRYLLTNKKFESTVGIGRDEIEDDATGNIKTRLMSMAEQAALHYDQLLFDVIRNGEAGLAYDGQPFYGSHQTGGVSVSNIGSDPLSDASLEAAIAQMMRVPMDNGQPSDIMPTHLLVPPELLHTGRRLINSSYTPVVGAVGGSGQMAMNPLFGTLKVASSARLTSSTEWHLLTCGRAVGPFIIQKRIEPEFSTPNMNENTGLGDTAFMRDELLYGTRSRDNAGYGLWQLAYKSSGAG